MCGELSKARLEPEREPGGDGGQVFGLGRLDAIAPRAAATRAIGDGQRHAFIQRPGEQRRLSTARVTGDDKALGIDIGSRQEIVGSPMKTPGPRSHAPALEIGVRRVNTAGFSGLIGSELGAIKLGQHVAALDDGGGDVGLDAAPAKVAAQDHGERPLARGDHQQQPRRHFRLGPHRQQDFRLGRAGQFRGTRRWPGFKNLTLDVFRVGRQVAVFVGEDGFYQLGSTPRPFLRLFYAGAAGEQKWIGKLLNVRQLFDRHARRVGAAEGSQQ